MSKEPSGSEAIRRQKGGAQGRYFTAFLMSLANEKKQSKMSLYTLA